MLIYAYFSQIDTRKGEDRANIEWVDAKYIALSNWLRFINTPNSAEMENVVAVQYKGNSYQVDNHVLLY
jgi:hypothetical protein